MERYTGFSFILAKYKQSFQETVRSNHELGCLVLFAFLINEIVFHK